MFNLREFVTTTKDIKDEEAFEMPDTCYGEVEYEIMKEKFIKYIPPENYLIVQPSFNYFFL